MTNTVIFLSSITSKLIAADQGNSCLYNSLVFFLTSCPSSPPFFPLFLLSPIPHPPSPHCLPFAFFPHLSLLFPSHCVSSRLPHSASLNSSMDFPKHTKRKMRRRNMGFTVGDDYGWSKCVYVCKSLHSVFCGQTEGSGKVDHLQSLMAHYLFMSPTTHGPLGKKDARVCVCVCSLMTRKLVLR